MAGQWLFIHPNVANVAIIGFDPSTYPNCHGAPDFWSWARNTCFVGTKLVTLFNTSRIHSGHRSLNWPGHQVFHLWPQKTALRQQGFANLADWRSSHHTTWIPHASCNHNWVYKILIITYNHNVTIYQRHLRDWRQGGLFFLAISCYIIIIHMKSGWFRDI